MSDIFDDVQNERTWFRNEIKALDMREGTNIEFALGDLDWNQIKNFCTNLFPDKVIVKFQNQYDVKIDYDKLLVALKYCDGYTPQDLEQILIAYKL